MGFKGIKGFGLGKTKENNAIKPEVSTNSVKVVKMKDTLNTKTKSLEETEAAVGPHGPIGELSLETDDPDTKKELDDEITQPPGTEPVIKVVEMSKKPEANRGPTTEALSGTPKAAETKTPEKPPTLASATVAKPEAVDDSLSNLFSSHEEEVNPLASLINSLPDVTVQELVDDLNEIRGIINEWQKG
jgi:hypothetical protein